LHVRQLVYQSQDSRTHLSWFQISSQHSAMHWASTRPLTTLCSMGAQIPGAQQAELCKRPALFCLISFLHFSN
jgi:hypothetical protein